MYLVYCQDTNIRQTRRIQLFTKKNEAECYLYNKNNKKIIALYQVQKQPEP